MLGLELGLGLGSGLVATQAGYCVHSTVVPDMCHGLG
jgi:hypothetical protein